MTVIVDASVAVKWFFEEPDHIAARALLTRDEPLVAPTLLVAEVANAAWKRFRSGEISRGDAAKVIALSGQPFSELFPLPPLLLEAGRLMLDFMHPAYDCFYLALALQENAPIATADRKLAVLAERSGVSAQLL